MNTKPTWRITGIVSVIVCIIALVMRHGTLLRSIPLLHTTATPAYEQLFQNGDIIFHTSLSQQSKAIQLATHSPYSHCGILYKRGSHFEVFEAVQPVQSTPLAEWIQRGKGAHFVVKRLRTAQHALTPVVLQRMKKLGRQWKGKPYDASFAWSDTTLYCSELVWKLYKRVANVELCPLQKLQSFDMTSATVQRIMRQRYGSTPPLHEPVVSPADIFASEKLTVVYEQ